jgi:hypothetical protein
MLTTNFAPDSPNFVHDVMLFLHIAGGSVGILAGYTALFTRTGERAHRAAGVLFMAGMLTMTLFAGILGTLKGQFGNVTGATMTAYLVLTAWATVRQPERTVGGFQKIAWIFAVAIGLGAIGAGLAGISPFGPGIPAGRFIVVYYVYWSVALLAAALDITKLARGGLAGPARISRHLWRMSLALFVATGSFFLGQQDEFPEAIRGPWWFVPALAPLVLLVFWLIRVRIGRRFRPSPATA